MEIVRAWDLPRLEWEMSLFAVGLNISQSANSDPAEHKRFLCYPTTLFWHLHNHLMLFLVLFFNKLASFQTFSLSWGHRAIVLGFLVTSSLTHWPSYRMSVSPGSRCIRFRPEGWTTCIVYPNDSIQVLSPRKLNTGFPAVKTDETSWHQRQSSFLLLNFLGWHNLNDWEPF